MGHQSSFFSSPAWAPGVATLGSLRRQGAGSNLHYNASLAQTKKSKLAVFHPASLFGSAKAFEDQVSASSAVMLCGMASWQ